MKISIPLALLDSLKVAVGEQKTIPDKDAAAKLVKEILQLAANKNEQQELKNNIGKLAITDADDKIANEILRTLNG